MIPPDTICSVCGIARNQPSPLCGAYPHPDLNSELLGPSQVPPEWQPSNLCIVSSIWPEIVAKTKILPPWKRGTYQSSFDVWAIGQFIQRIKRMNQTFEVGAPDQLTNLGLHRLQQFKMVISDEVSEGCDLIQQIITRSLDEGSLDSHQQLTPDEMVAFADWLGDLVVYVFSEAARWGIDLLAVLGAIMDSQDSKLGPDGKPIHDPVTHKFLKGPNYVAPEAAIKALLFGPNTDTHRPSTDSPTSPPEKFECPRCGYRENSWVQDGATYFCSRCLLHVRSQNNSEKSCGGVDSLTDKP